MLYDFSDKDVSQVPKQACVYRLLYKDGEVVYIGSSISSMHSRLFDHRKRKAFIRVTKFQYRKESSDKARQIEARLCANLSKSMVDFHTYKKPHLQSKRMPLPNSSKIGVLKLSSFSSFR